jgi:Uma2 family endonuclease
MDFYMPMSTTVRHNKITTTLISSVMDLLRKKEAHALSEECSLVYWGRNSEPASVKLVDISEITDMQKFTEVIIEDLYYVQPDIMIFKSNPYVENKRQTKTAGQPDLIVEVWSDSNLKAERDFKKYLYSTSDVTEHWYIEQDSNEVMCYLGGERIEDQALTDILVTRSGLEFDLRYLALKAK